MQALPADDGGLALRPRTSPTHLPAASLPAALGAFGTPTDLPSSPVRIPARAHAAYEAGAAIAAQSGCAVRWQVLAAIGYVESRDGDLNGHEVDANFIETPPAFGTALDGSAGLAFLDSDHGLVDGLRRWDRGVGPFHLLPTTWQVFGTRLGHPAQPQDLADSAAVAARYLCSTGRDLTRPHELRSALQAYRGSAPFTRAVLHLVTSYER